MKFIGGYFHTQMKVFSKFIFINKSSNFIKFIYIKEHKSTDGTRCAPNGDVSKEFKDGEYK
jgi:hypothetical protein